MVEYTWKTGHCKYENEGSKKVKVSSLHWTCTGVDGEFFGSSYGSISAVDQNRVYTLAALQAVPGSVMTGWIKQALGDEDVQRIEDGVAAQIAEKQVPTKGGFAPSA